MVFNSIYIPLQAVLERQNDAKRLLLTGTYLLTLYLNFFFDHSKLMKIIISS